MMSEDSLSLSGVIKIVWKSRWKIAAGSVAWTLGGVIYALLSKPVYLSDALIAPKDTQSSRISSGILSQFGGLGGVVAAQLGGANTNLARLEVLVKGREVSAKMIQEDSLAPYLFPELWNREAARWDSTAGSPPSSKQAAKRLRQSIIAIPNAKMGMMKVGVLASDSTASWLLTRSLLRRLNDKLRSDLVVDANGNMDFLNDQLSRTSDPLLREKIHLLMTQELERSMLVNSKLFEVLEHPVVPDMRIKPKRTKIVATSFLLGVFFTTFILLGLSFRDVSVRR